MRMALAMRLYAGLYKAFFFAIRSGLLSRCCCLRWLYSVRCCGHRRSLVTVPHTAHGVGNFISGFQS